MSGLNATVKNLGFTLVAGGGGVELANGLLHYFSF